MGIIRQIICSWIVSYTCISVGIIFAWPSSTYHLFMSNETVLHRPMTETEISLFGSLSSIGALISTPCMGYLLDKLGRKHCTTLCLLSHLLCWTIVVACSQVEVIITAIFIAGLGSSGTLVAPVFTSEICQENIRGAMSSGAIVSCSIGMFISYVLGFTFSYLTVAYVCLTMTVMSIITMIFVKESPTFLMMKGFEQEAAKSFAFYRSATIDSKEVKEEMVKLRRNFDVQLNKYNGEVTDESPEGEKLNIKEYTAVDELERIAEKMTFIKFLRKSRSTRKALFLSLTLMTLAVFQGISVLQVYAEPLFEQTMPDVIPFVSVVIFSLVLIISGFLAAYLTDTMGRRNLMIYSSISAGVCCVGLGSQLHVQWAPNWVTALFIYLYTASYTFGAGVAPYAVIAEVFLPEVKSVMCMIVYEWGWTCNFVILFIFNPLVSVIGLGPSFYILAIICIATAIFSIIYQPETKGLPIDVIQTLLEKSR